MVIAWDSDNAELLFKNVFGSGGSKNISLKEDLNSVLLSVNTLVEIITSAASKLRLSVEQSTLAASGPV